MPELAEVVYYKNKWEPGLGAAVTRIRLQADKRPFRKCDTDALHKGLKGTELQEGLTRGKQMVFRFSSGHWLGVHLGMAGKLFCEPLPYAPAKHDHLVLDLKEAGKALIFRDMRHFGRIRYDATEDASGPDWWQAIPPDPRSEDFTKDHVKAFLERRSGAPVKAVLLDQEGFPGIGNWMADEILWRARIHPAERAGDLTARQKTAIFKETVAVTEGALSTIAHHNEDPPEGWLFQVRWKDGGICPKTGKELVREEIGGRTTCWSPGRQQLNKEK
ncbi:MAG: Fpg/Nei family DNA glycosylase [Opitutales bacterium]